MTNMNSERQRPASASAGERVCPACRQPVETVVHRHKSMGVYVPAYAAGPCHNPRCEKYEPELVPADSLRDGPARSGPAADTPSG
ncbi:hypothetical protein DN402_01855 [Streptomyces sp. SW4]|nr:hypothetical protein DN402_01855 [Streptomyces sp. SW4]